MKRKSGRKSESGRDIGRIKARDVCIAECSVNGGNLINKTNAFC